MNHTDPTTPPASPPASPPEVLSGPTPTTPNGRHADPGDALPLAADHPPTMLVKRELDYLHWLASTLTGAGRAVELGCFLGGSTAAIVEGRRRAVPSGPHAASQLIVHDAFIAPDESELRRNPWMIPFDLQPGGNFRARYEDLNRDRLSEIDIREGWIPADLGPAAERALYPEQQPVELLFIDAAKTWETHTAILRTFARRMTVGGVLVQQDFMDLLPWLSVHMWQLKGCFEPLHLVRGAPTLSFRCVAEPAEAVDRAHATLRDFLESGDDWADIAAYWEGIIPDVGAVLTAAHESIAAVQSRDPERAVAAAARYEGWTTTAKSAGVYVSPFWPDWIARLPVISEKRAAKPEVTRRAAALAALRAARDAMPAKGREHAAINQTARDAAWAAVRERLRELGAERVALFGAGRHTRWLLGPAGPLAEAERNLEIVAVIDDAPPAETIHDVPVLTPDEAKQAVTNADAILPSSDAHEHALLARISECFGDSLPVVPFYTDAAETPERAPAPAPARTPRTTTARVRARDLEASAEHRAELGLPPERDWLEHFADRYAAPAWAIGYVNHRDGLLLWDLVEAARPRSVVEIGVASGVSSAVLLAATDRFPSGEGPARLTAVDIAERCYFDPDHAAAAAIDEVAPDLAHLADRLLGCSAIDAARSPNAPFDLAFIDGDHRHPAPALDLAALLFALAPGAWVALHDVELPAIQDRTGDRTGGVATGAQKLFRAWPFEKIQPRDPDPIRRNIAAIRMPADPLDAAPVLAELLTGPWETGAPSVALARALEPFLNAAGFGLTTTVTPRAARAASP